MVDNSLFINIFITIAAISIASVALLSLKNFENINEKKGKALKLSDLPHFKHSVGFLFLAFASCLVGFVISLFFAGIVGLFTKYNWSHNWIVITFNLVCVLIPLLFTLAFIYAAAGNLIRWILGVQGALIKGLAPKSMKPSVYCIENLIIRLGDSLTKGLFRNVDLDYIKKKKSDKKDKIKVDQAK